MKKAKSQGWPQGILKSVERAIQALPSEQEIKQGTEAINSLIDFLHSLRASLENQPTQQVRQDVLKATNVLSHFMGSYQAKILLAQKLTPVKSSITSEEEAARLFAELDALSLPDIQARLLDKSRYSTKDLKALAKFLSIGIDKNFKHEDVADTIFKRGFANPRGYDAIGGAPSRRLREGVVSEGEEHERGNPEPDKK